MKKIVTALYQVTPIEGFQINVTGPHDPIVALDGKILNVIEGQTFPVTPDMLNGMGASHFLFLDLLFLDPQNPGQYVLRILDDQGQSVDQIPKNGPDTPGGQSAQVQIKIRVEADAALLSKAGAKAAPKPAQPKKGTP